MLVVLIALAGAALEPVNLEQQMSEEEFERAGLGKLNREELAFLNEYLGRAAESPEDAFGREQLDAAQAPPDSSPTTGEADARTKPARSIRERIGRMVGGGERRADVQSIHTRIKGEFNGWNGHTLFVLENGQHWRQRVSGVYRYHAQNPEVTITKGRFGYYLVVDKTRRTVGVKRER